MDDRIWTGLTLTAAGGSALMAGTYFAFSTFIMPALNRLPQSQAIAAMQSINTTIVGSPFIPVFLGTAVATADGSGKVVRISADTTTDQRTGQTYYVVRVAMTPDQIARLGEVRLTPGMPVEAFIQTGQRTMLSYLIKPLHDQFMRAFREK